MNNPDQNPQRSRLRELLAIPDRNRTDEQWDELIELEILLAPGNREGAPMPGQRGNAGQPGGGQFRPHGGGGGGGMPGGQPRRHGGGPGKKSGKKFHKGPSRGNNGGGGGR